MDLLVGRGEENATAPGIFPYASLHSASRGQQADRQDDTAGLLFGLVEIPTYVCWHPDWRHAVADDDRSDPSVTFRFCWQSRRTQSTRDRAGRNTQHQFHNEAQHEQVNLQKTSLQ